MRNPDRSGEVWDAFLKQYRLKDIVDVPGGWQVASASGSVYRVSATQRIDRYSGSMVFGYACDCPARKRCRHIDAVDAMVTAEAFASRDPDAINIIERTEG